jgi:hypothetical protein
MEYWQKKIQHWTLIEAMHHGINLKYWHVARWIEGVPSRKICEAMELIGFPVWTSAPEDALKPW